MSGVGLASPEISRLLPEEVEITHTLAGVPGGSGVLISHAGVGKVHHGLGLLCPGSADNARLVRSRLRVISPRSPPQRNAGGFCPSFGHVLSPKRLNAQKQKRQEALH
jgi:hypothetical protein